MLRRRPSPRSTAVVLIGAMTATPPPLPPAKAVTLHAANVTASGLRYLGVVGKRMHFTASHVTVTDVVASGLRVGRAEAEDVDLFVTEVSGRPLGLLALSFTAALPPPLVPPQLELSDLDIAEFTLRARSFVSPSISVGNYTTLVKR